MNLEIGTRERFNAFVERIGDQDVVALVSHIDTDGVAAAVVANKVLQADHLYFLNYDELNDSLISDLKTKGVTKIVFTDLFLGDDSILPELEGFAEVLVVDHHLVTRDMNSARTTYIKCENGYCASYLCYELFSGIGEVAAYDWIVACASISDYCYEKNAPWMQKVFESYGQRFNPLTLRETPFWNLQWTLSLSLIYFRDNVQRVYDSIGQTFGEIGNLKSSAQKVQDELNILLQRFIDERKRIPGGYYWEFTPHFKLGGMVSSIVSGTEEDKKYVIVRTEGLYCFVSMRRQDKKENMAQLLQQAVEGLAEASAGGHVPAAGGHFLKRDLGTFKSRLGVSP